MPYSVPSYFTPNSNAPAKPWEEVLREVQRSWSENYQVDAPRPPVAPVPVNIVRTPGC